MDPLPHLKDITSYKRIVIKEFNNEDGIHIVEEPFDGNVEEGQYVAIVHSVPLSQSLLVLLTGVGGQQLPLTTGLKQNIITGNECSGVIIHPTNLRGKKIAFSHPKGTFRTIAVGNISDVIFIPDQIDLGRASCALVNPLTCCGLYQTSKLLGARAIINTAANSQLGPMIFNYFTKNGIEVINLVRGQHKAIEFALKYNAKHVLDIEGPEFDVNLKNLTHDQGATVCFDAYGGDISVRILNAMPQNSTLISYGSLVSPFMGQVNCVQLRWQNKQIIGFVVFKWMASQTQFMLEKVKQEVVNGLDGDFSVTIGREFPLDQFKEALRYYKENPRGDKVLIRM